MHGASKRQLFSRWAVIPVAIAAPFLTLRATPDDELRAAKLVENALETRWKQERASGQEQRKEAEELARAYARLVEKYPRHAGIRSAFAAYLFSIDQPRESEAQWEAAGQLDPNNPEIANRLAGCRLRAGRIKEADALFQKAVDLAPENAAYHYDLAVTEFLFRQQLEPSEQVLMARALEHYRRAAEIEPANLEYARGYAETFYSLPKPDWEEAARAWNHVMQISVTKDYAFVHLARVSLRRGDKDQARNYLSQVQDSAFSRVKSSLMRQIEGQK